MDEKEKESIKQLRSCMTGSTPVTKQEETKEEEGSKINVNGKKITVTPMTFKLDPDEAFVFKGVSKDSNCFSESECVQCSELNTAFLKVLEEVFDDVESVTTFFDSISGKTKISVQFRLIPDDVYRKSPSFDGENDRRAFKPAISNDDINKNNGMDNNVFVKYVSQSMRWQTKQNESANTAMSFIKTTPLLMNVLTNYLYRDDTIKNKMGIGNALWVPKLDYMSEFVNTPNMYGQGRQTNIIASVVLDATRVVKSLCDADAPDNKYFYDILYYGFNPNTQDALIEVKRINVKKVSKVSKMYGVNFVEFNNYLNYMNIVEK